MYPKQYQELLDFLDSNPEYLQDMRVRLLTPELIALPEKFAQLVEVVAQLSANFEAFAEETKNRLTALETAVAGLQGSDLERRARDNILNIARDELGLTRGRILLAPGRDTAQQFIEAMEAAEAQGIITRTDADNVLVADVIIRARRATGNQYVYAVFEVSRTVRRRDIQRARDRAATIAKATNLQAIAAVVGEIIRPQQLTQAAEMQVQALTPTMLQPREDDED